MRTSRRNSCMNEKKTFFFTFFKLQTFDFQSLKSIYKEQPNKNADGEFVPMLFYFIFHAEVYSFFHTSTYVRLGRKCTKPKKTILRKQFKSPKKRPAVWLLTILFNARCILLSNSVNIAFLTFHSCTSYLTSLLAFCIFVLRRNFSNWLLRLASRVFIFLFFSSVPFFLLPFFPSPSFNKSFAFRVIAYNLCQTKFAQQTYRQKQQ